MTVEKISSIASNIIIYKYISLKQVYCKVALTVCIMKVDKYYKFFSIIAHSYIK